MTLPKPDRAPRRTAAVRRCASGPILTSATAPPARRRRGHAAWEAGLRAEQAACTALLADGWTVLARRARTAAGEVDIVASRAATAAEPALLAFVEVKARPALSDAAAALSLRQQHRLLDAAAILLAANPDWQRDAIRFDLLLVDRAGTVRRIADAFRDERGC